MKRIHVFYSTLLTATLIAGCNKKLIEEPRSILTPAFFSSTQGFQQGLDAAYAGTRLFWVTRIILQSLSLEPMNSKEVSMETVILIYTAAIIHLKQGW